MSLTITNRPRSRTLRVGLWLMAASLAWMAVEAGVSLFAARDTESVALFGFGMDSLIEIASAAVIAWRLLAEERGARAGRMQRIERAASRIAGGLLLVLAAYLLCRAGLGLSGHGEHSGASPAGVAVTALALVVMPLLARAKLNVAAALESRALRADAMEAACCAWLAAATLAGLALNAALGWWWADSLAALILVPLLWREGMEAWRGECGCASRCGQPDTE